MTHDEQVKLWVEGKSVHGAGEYNECCPDFSCCRPEFQAPKEEREKFAAAQLAGDEQTTMGMLGEFLGRAMRIEYGKKVHVAGANQEPEKE